MIFFFRIFLLVFLLYHILVTLFWFGVFHWSYPQFPALIRDGFWIVFIGIIFFSHLSSLRSYRKQRKKLRFLFLILFIFSLFFSYIQNKSFYDMFVGFKYWFYYIFIFLSATFLWHTFAKSTSKKEYIQKEKSLQKFLHFFVWTLIITVLFWYIWQGSKLIFPDFFLNLWYGPLDDFQFWTNPPLYYLTGFEGTLRWQWIFSWPNNYGYFLVVFLPLIIKYFKFSIHSLKEIFTKKQHLISLFVYIVRGITILLTLSRNALLWSLLVLFIININRRKRHWKISIIIVLSIILWIFWLSFLKDTSTLAHISAKISSLSYVLQKPLGYGLWSSWPAIHHHWTMLPENYFIQILIDIWIIWFLLFASWYYFLFKKISLLYTKKPFWEYLHSLIIGLIALLIMWTFLHVFEDSMVNYTFFGLLWILGWYLSSLKKRA